MTIRQLIRLLWKNKFWIILFPLMVAMGIYFLTQNLPRQYESKSVIFTNPTTNRGANDGGVVRMDFYTSNNLFDNLTLIIKSRETLETVALKLLARNMALSAPAETFISYDSYNELKRHFSTELWETLSVQDNEILTFRNLKAHYEGFKDSPIEYLLREHDHYAINKINERLFVGRKASSDMLELTYRTNDPGICYQTLQLITASFLERYAGMKELENINSIKYFQSQLEIAQAKLRETEEDLKAFMSGNRILNYYEQGKYLDIAQLEHDQDEEKAKRLLSGTIANLKEIESMFGNFEKRQLIIERIATLQNEIVAKNLQIQALSLQKNQAALTAKLEIEIEALKQAIQEESKELFSNSNSLQGVQREYVLEEWLRLKILYEDQVQALSVMQRRKSYLAEKIGEFAPLGAELTKLERDVSVNEEQYLSILDGLNSAFLQKYDLEMSSSQKLIDEPYFPKSPLPSKRLILVAGSLMGSGFLVLTFIFISFFMDRTIKSKGTAEQLTNLKVAGGWINESKINKNIFKKSLENKLIKQFYNSINKFLPAKGKKIIAFYSLQAGEGKTFLSRQLIMELHQHNIPCEYWSHHAKKQDFPCKQVIFDLEKYAYGEDTGYWDEPFSENHHEIILWELPNIEETPLNYQLINKASVLILVLDSSRKWKSVDQINHDSFKEMVKIPHLIWLNKMEGDELEDLNGDIPRKRSKIRTRIKNIIS